MPFKPLPLLLSLALTFFSFFLRRHTFRAHALLNTPSLPFPHPHPSPHQASRRRQELTAKAFGREQCASDDDVQAMNDCAFAALSCRACPPYTRLSSPCSSAAVDAEWHASTVPKRNFQSQSEIKARKSETAAFHAKSNGEAMRHAGSRPVFLHSPPPF